MCLNESIVQKKNILSFTSQVSTVVELLIIRGSNLKANSIYPALISILAKNSIPGNFNTRCLNNAFHITGEILTG